jgi:hypothetical protein
MSEWGRGFRPEDGANALNVDPVRTWVGRPIAAAILSGLIFYVALNS